MGSTPSATVAIESHCRRLGRLEALKRLPTEHESQKPAERRKQKLKRMTDSVASGSCESCNTYWMTQTRRLDDFQRPFSHGRLTDCSSLSDLVCQVSCLYFAAM